MRGAKPGQSPVAGARDRRGARIHRTLHQQGEGERSPRGGGREGDHLRSRRQRRRRHHRLRRQPSRAAQRAHRHLQRVVHHQLPRPAGGAPPPGNRRSPGADDHRARVHQRPGPRRRLPRGSAAGPVGHSVHDSDHHRSGQGGRAGAARARGPTGRVRDSGTHRERFPGRPHLQRGPRDQSGGSRRGAARGIAGSPEGDPELQRRAAGVDRLQPRPRLVHLRSASHEGDRGPSRQGERLVRQRVGLLQPDARHHGGTGQRPP